MVVILRLNRLTVMIVIIIKSLPGGKKTGNQRAIDMPEISLTIFTITMILTLLMLYMMMILKLKKKNLIFDIINWFHIA